MNHRALGASGMTVSEVGLGTWQLGGTDWGEVDDETALRTLRTAADAGVDFFDTADVYGMGRSEELIGRFLRERPGECLVATKLGRFPEPGWPENFSGRAMRSHAEASLRRLGVDAIDLMQLHSIPTEVLREGEVFETLRAMQGEGSIRHWGVSVETVEEAEICLEQPGLTSLQVIFNIFRQKPIRFFETARRRGVALIVRVPLASGLLTGKFGRDTRFPESDHRSYNRDGESFNVGETFAGLPFDAGVELADALKPMVPEGMTLAQMALRWILDFDAVSTVIPGARSPSQVLANVEASRLPPLGADLHRRLSEFYEQRVARRIRGPY